MDFLDDSGPAMLGPELLRLLNLIIESTTTLLNDEGHDFPAHLGSTLLLLNKFGNSGKTEFAKRLGVSHQLTTHRINKLKKLGIVREKRDPKDGRRMLVSLTAKGKKAATSLVELSQYLERAYFELFDEVGIDLFDAVICARKCLEKRPLNERMEVHKAKAKARQKN